MEELQAPSSSLPRRATYHSGAKLDAANRHPFTLPGIKKRGQGSRSWIQIDQDGNSQVIALDKASVMRKCKLPARDLRLLDPLFVYPSTLLGREKAIVVSLEHIRCIIMADEVILMNSMDGIVLQYENELCRRLKSRAIQNDDLPFEFRALELALELACMSLDSQVTELEIEVYPVLEKLASSISTLDLEHVRRLKSSLLSLTRRVQKVRDEIEHLMDDDGDMAEMYLTEKKERMEAYSSSDPYFQSYSSLPTVVSKSAPVSPVGSVGEAHQLERTSSKSSKHGSFRSSFSGGEHIQELEMLLEAYFVVIDNSLSKLLSLKEFIDDTEDFINIKLDNVRNQLIQFELLLTAATFICAIFAVVTGVFGMNFTPSFLDVPDNFNWVLVVTGILGGVLYSLFLAYFKYKRLLPV